MAFGGRGSLANLRLTVARNKHVTNQAWSCTLLPDMLPTNLSMKHFITACSALLLLSCGGPPDSARVAQRHLARGDYQAASAAADKSLRTHPKDPTSWRVKIRASMAQGELARAAGHYQEWKTLRGEHDATTYQLMAVSTLWQGMQVPAPEIKTRSIQIIERHEVEKLADLVRDAMGDDSDLVAAAAAVALLRSHPAAPHLASELLRSPSAKVRAMVVLGIGKKVGRIAIGDIVPALEDADPSVRRAAISAIAAWKNKKDLQRLLTTAKSDADPQVRSRALRGLLSIGGIEVIELGLAALRDPYPGARLAAFSLLEKFAVSAALVRAKTLLVGDDLPLAMRAAVFLHKQDNDSDLVAMLNRAYASPDWASRAAVMNTAAQVLAKPEATRLAQQALADQNEDVQLAAARLLLRLGAKDQAIAALRRIVASTQFDSRLQATTELARLGDTQAIASLGRLAQEGVSKQQRMPAQQLAAIAAHGSAKVVSDGLVAALGDSNIRVRLAAADVLLD